jgi:uncharacterized membrane protein
MNEKAESLQESVEGAAQDEVVQEAAQATDGASEGSQDRFEESVAGFEERLEGFVGEAGNFMARNIADDPDADDNDKIWGLAAYITQVIVPIVVPVIMLVIEPNKNRPFQKFHAVQALGFLVAAFVYEILAGVVFSILTAATLGCLGAILWILFLVPIVPALYYAYLAYQGKRFEMPYLTNFMREQGWL